MISKSSKAERPTLQRLFAAELELAKLVDHFGGKMRLSPETLKAKLPLVSEGRILRACENLELTSRVLLKCGELQVNPKEDMKFFKLTMEAMGMKYPSNTLDGHTETRAIEAYNLEQFQIFRNFRFMEISSYSLAEIMAYEWYELYDRPKMVNDELISYASDIVFRSNRSIPVSVPIHHLREKFGGSQVIVCDFKTIAPLYSGPDKPYGFVVTIDAEIVPQEGGGTLSFF